MRWRVQPLLGRQRLPEQRLRLRVPFELPEHLGLVVHHAHRERMLHPVRPLEDGACATVQRVGVGVLAVEIGERADIVERAPHVGVVTAQRTFLTLQRDLPQRVGLAIPLLRAIDRREPAHVAQRARIVWCSRHGIDGQHPQVQ